MIEDDYIMDMGDDTLNLALMDKFIMQNWDLDPQRVLELVKQFRKELFNRYE
jgi:hypothetical protein